MPSTYTTRLRLTLPATGELTNTWGTTVNTGITELVDASIAGAATLSTWGGAGVAYTLSNNNGVTDEARCMFIVASGSPGEAKNIICPAVSKLYVVKNEVTGGFSVTLKTASGSGITVENGKTAILRCTGTDVVDAITQLPAFSLAGGTVNGVVYLNASRTLTTGSALTFDGTNLGTTGGINAGNNVIVTGGSIQARNGIQIYSWNSDTTNFAYLQNVGSTGAGNAQLAFALQTSGEQMRLTSTGLGIGTSSPATKLHVNTGAAGYGVTIAASAQTSITYQLGIDSNSNLAIYDTNAAAQRLVLSNSGNLLVGTTSTGADGLGISNLLNLTFPEGSGTSYANLFRQASSGATVIANGYKRSATASGFASSIGTSWAKTAIGLGVGTGDITFYADPAGTVANGTDVTPSERARITSAGDFIHQVNGTAPSLSTNSTMSFELTSNTSLKIVVRGTDGVTRSTTLTLT
jgi:hypothetical protein